MKENSIVTWDGLRLFYRAWNTDKLERKAIILFHSGHEHSGRFNEIVEILNLKDYMYFAWDARGHGRSEGRGDYARTILDLKHDLSVFIQHILKKYSLSMSNLVLLGSSLGGLLISSYVYEYKPEIRAMILGSPLFRVRTYIPFDRLVLRILGGLKSSCYVNSYVLASMLTHDKKEIEERKRDPLITRPIGVRMLLSTIEEGARLIKVAPEITVPTLMLCSGNDWVASLPAEKKFYNRLGSKTKEIVIYPGLFHDIFHERDKHMAIKKVHLFLESLDNKDKSNSLISKQ